MSETTARSGDRYIASSGAALTLTGPAIYDITLTANCVLTVNGLAPITAIVRQDATGSRSLGFSSNVLQPAAFPATTTTATHFDVLEFIPNYDGTFDVALIAQNVSPKSPVAPAPSPAAPAQVLVTPNTSFDGFGRNARDLLNNLGACGSLVDATPAQYAAALEATHISVLRTNGVGTNIGGGGASSLIGQMQAIRAAQASLGSARLVTFLCLVMAYLNDAMPWTAQEPLLLAMIQAGLLYGIEGPNEINNPGTGNGSRGPNDMINKTAQGSYEPNYIDWMTNCLLAMKTANAALFNQFGTVIVGGTVAPIQGSADYTGGNMVMELLADFWAFHFYAGNAFQPSLPFGFDASGKLGYFANAWAWAKAGYSPHNLRQGIVTECGASTCGHPQYATDGESQCKYLLNQHMEASLLNAHGVFIYQLFDGSGNVGDTEGNFGLYHADKVTPKPSGLAIGRLLSLYALNNNPDDPANAAEKQSPAAFKPGINPARCVINGVTNLPNGMAPALFVYKSDGSCLICVWNEPVIDSDGKGDYQGGTDVTPAADPVTVYLPHAYNWRLHDPMGTDSLTAGTFTNGDTVTFSLSGYPMVIELAPPPGYTQAGGDPANATATGFPTFTLGQYNNNYAHNYGGAAPDDQFVLVGPPTGKFWTPGNVAICIAASQTGTTPSMPGPLASYGPFVEQGSDNQTVVFAMPIQNRNQVFKVSNTSSAASMQVFEIPPYTSYGISHGVCTTTGANYSLGNTVTAPLIAVPQGALGFFVVVERNESGAESYAQSSDTSVVIRNPIIVTGQAFQTQGFSGTIAAGRPAGPVTWQCNNLNVSPTTQFTVVSMWFASSSLSG